MLNYSLHTSSGLNAPPAAARMFTGGLFAKTLPARQLQNPLDTRRAGSRRDRHGRRIKETVGPQAEPLGSILCVEHEEETAGPLAETLIELGCTVDVAHDGEVGLAKIVANRPTSSCVIPAFRASAAWNSCKNYPWWGPITPRCHSFS